MRIGRRLRGCLSAICFLVMLSASHAIADEAFNACLKSSPADDAHCGEEWVAREQTRLDVVWQELVTVADGEVARKIADEQRAWEAFRDVSCTFKLDAGFGGAGGPNGYHACRAEVIASRAAALEAYVKYIDN